MIIKGVMVVVVVVVVVMMVVVVMVVVVMVVGWGGIGGSWVNPFKKEKLRQKSF